VDIGIFDQPFEGLNRIDGDRPQPIADRIQLLLLQLIHGRDEQGIRRQLAMDGYPVHPGLLGRLDHRRTEDQLDDGGYLLGAQSCRVLLRYVASH
jgi:hypothetical protein